MAGSETGDDRVVPADHDRQLKALGFDPGTSVCEITCAITVEQIQRALFESSYSHPIDVPFTYSERGEAPETWILPMMVELVQVVYTPFAVSVGDAPVGCHEHPSLYLRGFLRKSAFDPYPETVRMHVFLEVEPDENVIETGTLQLVRHPSGADSDSPLKYVERAPG